MYRFFIAFLLLLCATSLSTKVAAQEDSTTLSSLIQKIVALEKSSQETEIALESLRIARDKNQAYAKALEDSLAKARTQMMDLLVQLDTYRSAMERQEAVLKNVTRRVELTDEARYKLIYSNLTNTAYLFELMNEKLNTLRAISQVESYRTALGDLNNPADESLGFSYNKKVLQLLNSRVKPRRGGEKMLQMAKLFLDDPTVQSVTSSTPILNIGTSLVSLIANVAIQDKDVSASDVTRFKEELDKYTIYYVRLNDLNSRFQSSLQDYDVQVGNLHNKIAELVTRQAQLSGISLPIRSEKYKGEMGAYLQDVFRSYNRQKVHAFLTKIENDHKARNGKVNYTRLMERKGSALVEMNKDMEEVIYLYKQFEYLYRQYIAMLEENNRGMMEVLTHAKKEGLSDEPAKIEAKMEALKKQKEEAVRGIHTAINIEKLKDVVVLLDEFLPIL